MPARFIKDGPKNRLREMDVNRIVDAYRHGDDIPGVQEAFCADD